MKKLVFILLMGFLVSFIPGCTLDDDECYSVNNAWVGFGLIQKDSILDTFIINMDDGEVLYPTNNSLTRHNVNDNERILTNFTILGNKENEEHNEEYYVTINSLRKILYKGILDITPEIEDSIGNDPIQVKDKWIKGDMLNFELKYNGGNTIHFINLVKQPGEITAASEPVVLELRHNNNDDPDQIPLSAIVTFDLSALKIEGKNSTQFKVIATDPDDSEFEYTAEYKY